MRTKDGRTLLGKKGMFIIDIILLVTVVFMMAVVFIVFGKNIKEVTNDFVAGNDDIPTTFKVQAQEMSDNSNGFWDGAFLFIFIGMILALWISVWFIDTHPVFFVVLLIVMVIVTVLGMFFGNAYVDMMTNSDYTATANEMMFTTFIMSNFALVMTVVGFITGALLFAKTRQNT